MWVWRSLHLNQSLGGWGREPSIRSLAPGRPLLFYGPLKLYGHQSGYDPPNKPGESLAEIHQLNKRFPSCAHNFLGQGGAESPRENNACSSLHNMCPIRKPRIRSAVNSRSLRERRYLDPSSVFCIEIKCSPSRLFGA